MNKFEAWTVTIIILAILLAIPTWVYRWFLLLIVMPLLIGVLLL